MAVTKRVLRFCATVGPVVLLSLAPTTTRGEPPRSPIEMLDDGQLTDVFFLDADQGWAVGDRGVILHTEDGGRHWKLQESKTGCRLESVCFVNERIGWVVGGWVVPYTHRTSCVVLRTQDGGRTWTRDSRLTLPALTEVKFFDERHGWAVGTPSSLYPTGIFRSEDGGRSWTPLPSGTGNQWLAADFSDPEHGVAVGRNGRLTVVSGHKAMGSSTPPFGQRPLNDIVSLDALHGWLVGDGGLVMQTADAGHRWQVPQGRLPAGVGRAFDFRTVAVLDSHVWLAGAPGTLVLHSPDNGNTWQHFSTGQALPISALTFVDANRGWAVGSLGTILATRDGGRNWRRQRSGGTRLALLGMFSEPSRIPWELLALQSGNQGFLGGVELLTQPNGELSDPNQASSTVQTAAALQAVGASCVDSDWRFPLRQPELRFSAPDVVATWNRINDGDALQLMEERLVRAIRQWRPEVIITEPPSPQGDRPLAQIINQVVLVAAQHAADATQFPDQMTKAELKPWTVKKVFTTTTDSNDATITVTTAQLATQLGRSLAAIADESRAVLNRHHRPGETKIGFRLVYDRLPQATGERDIFSGVFLQAGGEARRRAIQASHDLATLTRAAQKRRNIEQLLKRSIDNESAATAWLGQVRDLTAGVSPRSAGALLGQLGQRYAEMGHWDLAAQAFEQLIDSYPDHPLGDQACSWLITYNASAEIAWQLRRGTRFQTGLASAHVARASSLTPDSPADQEIPAYEPKTTRSVQAAFNQQTQHRTAGPSFNQSERAQRAVALARTVQQRRPELFAEPAIQFPVSVAYRAKGLGRDAERIFHRLSALPTGSAWKQCAGAELWLAHGRGMAPKPAHPCRRSVTRPVLDGNLNDRTWRNASPTELTSPHHEDANWPAAALLSYDDQFLYLAASCRKSPGFAYTSSPGPRPRDPDLSNRDRVEFLIDIDRDYASYYRLTVDHRGWTGEACFGNVHWNPTWYVATESSADEWTIEAAIPLDELVPQAPGRDAVWSLGIQRVVPGVGFQSSTRPAAVRPIPQGFGLLVFE